MDMDETYINSLIRKQTAVKFNELKKWELEAILEQEEVEKTYLEEFLHDYKDVKLNAHIFHNQDDLLLTKLDSVFDSMVYDGELFNIDKEKNIELYAFSHILMTAGSLFAAYFNLEIYN